MTIKVRFAPSPTGHLHLGNIRAAALNYFLAKSLNGSFLLRIDNTDVKRSKQEYIDSIKSDLTWLGYIWQEECQQLDRLPRYNEVLNLLEQKGYVYKCYETPEELDYKKKLQLAKKQPPIYDREALNLKQEKQKQYIAEGRKPHYRFKMSAGNISWNDLIKGNLDFKAEHISDPVIIREDGIFLYILTSVIDDLDKQISHIVRGEDHIVNTAVQIQMFKAVADVLNVDYKLPQFAHFSMVVNEQGMPFSKRDNSLSIKSLKQQGILPLAINTTLFTLGLSENNTTYNSIHDIINSFDITKYSKSTVQLSLTKLKSLNVGLLQNHPFNQIQNMVQNLFNINISQDFWDNIKANIKDFSDIAIWHNIVHNTINTAPFASQINTQIIQTALNTMPQTQWNETTWSQWLQSIKQHNYANKDVFTSLRLALTGLHSGMEFKVLILLLGKNLITARLQQALNN